MLSIREPFQKKDTQRLKVKGWKKIFYANEKKAVVVILNSDNIDSKTKAIIKTNKDIA